MKRMIAAGIILFIVIGICIGDLILLQNEVENFKCDVKNISDMVNDEKIDAAINETNIMIEKWQKKHAILSSFIDHEPLKQIEINFNLMRANLEQDEVEEFFFETEEALINLEHLNVTEQPLLGNIL